MNTTIQVDTFTLGFKAEILNATVVVEFDFYLENLFSHTLVYLASSIPSIGGNSISAITPDFVEEGIQTTSLAA